MHPLAERVLRQIRREELLDAGERVGVAVSGGIDSVALLRLMIELRGELGAVLSVVHFNHKVRGEASEADQEFVAQLAGQHGIEFICDSDDVAGHAREQGVSLETAARELRYGFFRYLVRSRPTDRDFEVATPGNSGQTTRPRLNRILTGHTLDDQAETVLMRLIRGSGLRGLGGIHPRIPVEGDDEDVCGEIVRPLLSVRRLELEQYLHEIGQACREDATNSDESFTRNRVRKLLVPLLQKEFNPSIAENLSELAEIARGEEDYWDNEVAGWMGTGVHWSTPEWAPSEKFEGLVQIGGFSNSDRKISAVDAGSPPQIQHPSPLSAHDLDTLIRNATWLVMNASVDRAWFLGEPIAVQRRIVKAIGDEARIPLEFRHVEEVLRFASAEGRTGKELSLPLGWKILWYADELLFATPDLRTSAGVSDYQYPLTIPGRVEVHECRFTIEARRISGDEVARYNPDELLDADSVIGPLVVRNWRAGDRFWPAHTKSPKKIKELVQERHVAQPERGRWPVIVHDDEIIWMRGFPVPAKYKSQPGKTAVAVLETLSNS